jgi:hypothetical protein
MAGRVGCLPFALHTRTNNHRIGRSKALRRNAALQDGLSFAPAVCPPK